jgi:hypothetical protein
MTEAEVRQLLKVCGEYDGTTYGEPAVATWTDALDNAFVPNLSYDEALCAVVAHYDRTPVRVKPQDVLQRIRDDRLEQVAPVTGLPRYGVPPNEAYRAARAELEAMNAARKAGR